MDARDSQNVPGALDTVRLARDVLSELDLEVVLRRVLESARELSGARYAALGVTDQSQSELERFITIGIDEDDRERIGDLPKGRGVLGELIAHPVPLRLADVGAHPHSYGFPPGHPPMRTFLGVPVLIGGVPFGNLYLTEKAGGEEFTEADEQTIMLLAEFAGRGDRPRAPLLPPGCSAHRAQADRRRARRDHADRAGARRRNRSGSDPGARGQARTGAGGRPRAGDRARTGGGDGRSRPARAKFPLAWSVTRVDIQDSLASAALRTSRTLRLEDQPNRARFERHGLGQLGVQAEAGLVVPLIFRGRGYGVLIAVDRLEGGPVFSNEDQRLLEAFAASAATAVATAVTVDAERRRQRIAAAEQERAHWARELHDETLQNLAALRLGSPPNSKAPDRRPSSRRSARRSASSSARSARSGPHDRMLYTAYILINRSPIFGPIIQHGIFLSFAGKTCIIPRGFNKGIKSIGFTTCILTAFRA